MDLNTAIELFSKFKGESLQSTLRELERLENDTPIHDFKMLFAAAGIIKKNSSQVDEVVHAVGIMLAKAHWLKTNEKVTYLSLGAGNHKGKFDLETNLRVAEFKFGKWNAGSANGIRRRSYFGNYVNLLTADDQRKRYFVVEDKLAFEIFLKGSAEWRKVLSKNPTSYRKLEHFLEVKGLENLITVSEIYKIAKPIVQVIDFKEVIN